MNILEIVFELFFCSCTYKFLGWEDSKVFLMIQLIFRFHIQKGRKNGCFFIIIPFEEGDGCVTD